MQFLNRATPSGGRGGGHRECWVRVHYDCEGDNHLNFTRLHLGFCMWLSRLLHRPLRKASHGLSDKTFWNNRYFRDIHCLMSTQWSLTISWLPTAIFGTKFLHSGLQFFQTVLSRLSVEQGKQIIKIFGSNENPPWKLNMDLMLQNTSTFKTWLNFEKPLK